MGDLSPRGMTALLGALATLPDDRMNPVPLCERISQLLDVMGPLIASDLPIEDRTILLTVCYTDRRLVELAELINAMDARSR